MKHARADYDRIQDPAGKIPDNEPVFLLRGQDISAPWAVEEWIKHAKANGARPDIIAAAREQLARMNDWQDEHGNKVPDL